MLTGLFEAFREVQPKILACIRRDPMMLRVTRLQYMHCHLLTLLILHIQRRGLNSLWCRVIETTASWRWYWTLMMLYGRCSLNWRLMQCILLLLNDFFLLLDCHFELLIFAWQLLQHQVHIQDFVDSNLIDELCTSLSEPCCWECLFLVIKIWAHVSNHDSLAVTAKAIS